MRVPERLVCELLALAVLLTPLRKGSGGRLLLVPPHTGPAALAGSGLVDAHGWVPVDPYTMRASMPVPPAAEAAAPQAGAASAAAGLSPDSILELRRCVVFAAGDCTSIVIPPAAAVAAAKTAAAAEASSAEAAPLLLPKSGALSVLQGRAAAEQIAELIMRRSAASAATAGSGSSGEEDARAPEGRQEHRDGGRRSSSAEGALAPPDASAVPPASPPAASAAAPLLQPLPVRPLPRGFLGHAQVYRKSARVSPAASCLLDPRPAAASCRSRARRRLGAAPPHILLWAAGLRPALRPSLAGPAAALVAHRHALPRAPSHAVRRRRRRGPPPCSTAPPRYRASPRRAYPAASDCFQAKIRQMRAWATGDFWVAEDGDAYDD